MEKVLKYHRLQGKLSDTLKTDKITAMSIEENSIVLGTEDGYIHFMSFEGDMIKSLKAHDRPINDISVDNSGSTVASCSDNGTVVVLTLGPEGDKDHVIRLNEPIKAVCIEDDINTRRERSFVVGGLSGQLIQLKHNRQIWSSQKSLILFPGADSPVSAISWRGNIIAWADSNQVRLLDASTMSAICFLNSPVGVSSQNPYPCQLFWESESDLLVGWADNFRHLELVTSSSNVEQQDTTTVNARITAEWQADLIICGLSSFDHENVVLLGYVPPETDPSEHRSSAAENYPEVQVLNHLTGALISVDCLPLRGGVQRGPWSYSMVSNYSCYSRRRDYNRWKLGESKSIRGGNRGLAPTCFITSGQDFVVARVRDTNDRIFSCLEQVDLKGALDLALADRSSLRQYQIHDLVTLYIEDLLMKSQGQLAASECQRLIGYDALLWERWILTFAAKKQLRAIAAYIPTASPRLPPSVYEVVLEDFLQNDTEMFLWAVKKWSRIVPSIFDQSMLVLRLEAADLTDRNCLEAEAELHLLARNYDKAINAYLEMEGERTRIGNRAADTQSQPGRSANFFHIFEMIEREDLFYAVRDKLANLVRLSRVHAEAFFVRNIERLPIPFVVKQLRSDRRILHWYLHIIFKRCLEQYNAPEYAEYHVMQVSLYAEFASKFMKPIPYSSGSLVEQTNIALNGNNRDATSSSSNARSSSAYGQCCRSGFDLVRDRVGTDSDFLKFLKTSSYVPWELALKECEKRRPPLFNEMVYILAKMGESRDALGLLLREIGDAYEAIRFIESNDPQLWSDLLDYSLHHQDFLAQLLDFVGVCNIDPLELISKIPPKMKLPHLRKKLQQVLSQYDFQVFVNDVCNDVLDTDAQSLLRQLNQSRRKALRVSPLDLRCTVCARPLYLPNGPLPGRAALDDIIARVKVDKLKVWGLSSTLAGGDAVVFPGSGKIAFHRHCFDQAIDSQSDENVAANSLGPDDLSVNANDLK